MKSFNKYLILAAVLFFINGVAAPETHAQINRLREIKVRMDKFNKNLSTMRMTVTMAKVNAQLADDDPEISTGTALYAKRPGKDALVRIDWKKPEESLAVKDGQYVLYRPRLAIAYTGSVKSATSKETKGTSALAFMNMSKAELDANFDVIVLSENATLSDGTKTFQLQLTPKTRTSYKSAEVWVNVDGMPQQTKITEHNNDTTTVLLTDPKMNISLTPADFSISIPKGTKVQKS